MIAGEACLMTESEDGIEDVHNIQPCINGRLSDPTWDERDIKKEDKYQHHAANSHSIFNPCPIHPLSRVCERLRVLSV